MSGIHTLSSMRVFTTSAKRPDLWKGSPQSWGGPIWKSVVRIRVMSMTFVSTACDIALAKAWNNSTAYCYNETQFPEHHVYTLPRHTERIRVTSTRIYDSTTSLMLPSKSRFSDSSEMTKGKSSI